VSDEDKFVVVCEKGTVVLGAGKAKRAHKDTQKFCLEKGPFFWKNPQQRWQLHLRLEQMSMSVAPLPGVHPVPMSRPQVGIERLPTRRMSNEPRESMNCKSCRKRKIKCNRLRPACEACQVFQCPCIYDAVPKKRGPKTDVLEALLKRVDGLEARLKDQKNSETSPSTEDVPAFPGEDAGSATESAATTTTSAASEPKAKRPALDTARAANAVTESAIYSPTVDSEPSPGVQVDALLDTYFTRFHAKPYHILDESTIRQRLQLDQLPEYLVHAIYAVAARYTPHPAGYQSAVKLSEEYASRSRSEIDTDEPSIDALQALLLLVTAFTAAGKGRKAYMLMSMFSATYRLPRSAQIDLDD
jgi:hypothetical protein